jgi:hypothetical protein
MREVRVSWVRRGAWVAGICLAMACSQSPAALSKAAAEAQAEPASTPAQKLVAAYLSVQQKLVADDVKAARASFTVLRAAADAPELTAEPALRQQLSAAAAAGAAAKDLDGERAAFSKASESLLQWLRREGNPLAKSVRVAHCPMAADGKGARWVQLGPKLENPYYGSEMLTCGSIETEVKPGTKLKS